MASLALGIVGAVVGSFFGAPQIGFLIGSMIGSLIDPPKSQGPRLSDLKLQGATYGKMIPFFWGDGRLAGNMIDQTDLKEHKQKSNGKGGEQITNFTYSASFDISLGAARIFGEDAIIGINRIWADGRLIWDATVSPDPIPCTVYAGGEDQLPDPTFEAVHGVGNVPAYRGQAHVVFADYFLTDFGNRIPAFEFEVYTSAGDIPFRVSTFAPWGNKLNREFFGASYADGVITTTSSTNTSPVTLFVTQWDIQGNVITPETAIPIDPGYGPWNFVANTNDIALFINGPGGGTDIYWYSLDLQNFIPVQGALISPDAILGEYQLGGYPVKLGGYIFAVGNNAGAATYIVRYGYASGIAGNADTSTRFALDALYSNTSISLGTSNDGHLYIIAPTGVGTQVRMWKVDTDFNLIRFWDSGETSATLLQTGGTFHVYNDIIVTENVGGGPVCLVKIGPGGALSDYGLQLSHIGGPSISLGGGLMLDYSGVYSLAPPPGQVQLSKIISDLSTMTPIGAALDVSELTDSVRWFVVAQQMVVRNAIQSLRQVFFFDAVESDDIVKFRKRSETPVFSIPDKDLEGRGYGEDAGDPLRTIRKREQELPRTVTLTYIDVDTDFQAGAQNTPRQTTLSQQDVNVEVPVGLTADEALQKCWTLQAAEWIERESFEWSTTRKWAHLEPCDVGVVRGRVIRILTRTESPNGVIKWTGVLAAPSEFTTADSSIYNQTAPAPPSDGHVTPPPPGPPSPSSLILLDIALPTDEDAPNGYPAALYPTNPTGSWSGAAVYKSADGFATSTDVGDTTDADVVGTVASALGNFYGGNIVDNLNVITVIIISPSGTLESITSDALLNGLGLVALGNAAKGYELLQYMTATLIAANTYELSGLLRGRRGTEWAMGTHVATEKLIVLPTTVDVIGPGSELGISRQFKGVTYGQAISDVTAQSFTNTGVALMCYSPAQVSAVRAPNGDLLVSWRRRTRIGGLWKDNVDVPLSEASELYRVRIYSSSAYTTIINEWNWALQDFNYAVFNQIFDFGSPVPATVYGDVVQVGAVGDGYATRFSG